MPRETAISIAVAAPEAETASPLDGQRIWRRFDDEELFFRTWLNEPVAIGAVMPTREPLARAMARAVLQSAGVRAGKRIVELGGGTGPLTRALALSAPDPDAIAVVERNPVFHRLLQRRFPHLQLILGDAEDLVAILRDHRVGAVGAVVSSLPRVGWPVARQRHALIRELGLAAARVCRVWCNFPPATVWSYRLR
jgi:phosphatidylethanolamine/phosphatidyl-N-methylethanolamine N-methyltransferase